ncbi:MAG: DUF3606 domain-containing protein [Burkholderiaceae bacterium]|nr:DUF3606 domain-containing protein [Burkholderiaceae bacterium]
MADNKQEVGKPDRDRIDKDDLSEVRRVATKCGTSTAAVREAIAKVGPMRADVERELTKGEWSASGSAGAE